MKERLAIAVRLQIGSAVHEVPGGNVRQLSLRMTPYGVEGTLELVLQDDQDRGGKYRDELLADFVKPDLAKLELSIRGVHRDNGVALDRGEIKCGGIILERQIEEQVTSRVLDAPSVLGRRYRVTFCDPARALWSQHFPCELATNKSFADVVAAHQGTLSVAFDWDAIQQQVPLVFFHLDPERRSSFYDLVIWYVRTREGALTYDQRAQSYSIQASKGAASSAIQMVSGELQRVVSSFPEVPRHVPRVKCSYSEAPTTTVLTNTDAASGVFRDVLLRTPIAKEVDSRGALEKSRPLSPAREVALEFARFPSDAPLPGTLFELPGASSTGPLSTPSEFRVFELVLEARALEDNIEVDYGDATTAFDLSVSARLEAKEERRVRLPAFRAPHFPGFLEGKVVSEVGANDELTYQIYTDEATSVDNYHVKVPLFQDQIVLAPYEPHSGGGMLYLPLYKGERVLLAFEFDRVRVRELLDWRGETRVALATQGEQLFLGKTAKNNTSLLHDYQAQKPVFRILRTNANDTSYVRMEEGRLTLRVEEKAGA